MAFQAIFKRYEIKYMLTLEQKQLLLQSMAPYMELDRFGRSTIRNIYFDTPDFRLIRRSIERPVYKEKLRLRSYSRTGPNDPVYVELKKKYRSVVYKRRMTMPEGQAMDWVCQGGQHPDTQIGKEIDYFRSFYPALAPAVYLSYEREAYFCKNGSDLRITFDENVLCRQERLSLAEPPGGETVLPEGSVLMEVKTAANMPMWLVRALSENRIYKTSFSKYGKAYQSMILPKVNGGFRYA